MNHDILEGLPVIRLYLLKLPHVLRTHHHMVRMHHCSFPSQQLSQPPAEAKPSEQPDPISELALLLGTGNKTGPPEVLPDVSSYMFQ